MIVDAAAEGVTVTALDVARHHPKRRVGRAAWRDGRRRPGASWRGQQGPDGVPNPRIGRGGRRQLGDAGDGRRVRQGARAVRPHHRYLPGRQAPRRQHARQRRGDHRGHLGRSARRRPRQRLVRRRGRRIPCDPYPDLQRAEQHSVARRYRLHVGARRPPLPAPGPHTLGDDGGRYRPAARCGRGPAQRPGARRVVHAALRGGGSTAARRARPSQASARCPRTNSATSSSTPATWCRIGPSPGAGPRTCSSSWSSRRSSPASTGPTWGSRAGWR